MIVRVDIEPLEKSFLFYVEPKYGSIVEEKVKAKKVILETIRELYDTWFTPEKQGNILITKRAKHLIPKKFLKKLIWKIQRIPSEKVVIDFDKFTQEIYVYSDSWDVADLEDEFDNVSVYSMEYIDFLKEIVNSGRFEVRLKKKGLQPVTAKAFTKITDEDINQVLGTFLW